MHPNFFFSSCALVASKVVRLAVTCPAGLVYDCNILTYLTRWGYPSLAYLSPSVGLYVTRMTVSWAWSSLD